MMPTDGNEKVIYIKGTIIEQAYSAGLAVGYKQDSCHWKWLSTDYLPKLNYGKMYINSNAGDIKTVPTAMLLIVEVGMDFACPFISTT